MDVHHLVRWRPGAIGRWILLVVSLSAIPLVGWAHFASGREIEFHAFYLLPVAVASWYGGRGIGLFTACLSAADWLVTEYLLMPPESSLWVPLVNEILRFAILAVAALTFAQLRLVLDREIELARRDPLTRLLNRRAFEEMCELEIKRANRYGHFLTAVMMDLDNFKEVNDTLGHRTGDELLQEVARVLTARMRAFDVAGRLGGDEFALVLPHTDWAGAEHFAGQLRDAILETMKRHGWPVTVSAGVAVFPTTPRDVAALLKPADDLLYRAKEEGKNAIRAAVQKAEGG